MINTMRAPTINCANCDSGGLFIGASQLCVVCEEKIVSNIATHNQQVLVAIDWDNVGLSPQPILDFLGKADAFVEWTFDPDAVGPDNRGTLLTRTRPVHRFFFDAGKARNTEVHGVGFRAGFVVHIEQAEESS